MKNYVLPILIIVIGVGISGFLLFGGSADGPSGNQAGNISKENLRELQLNIDGMFCIGCERSIEGAVSSVSGVVEANADLNSNSGRVIYDSTKTSKQDIVNLPIFSTYPATVVSDEKFRGNTGSLAEAKLPSEVKSQLDRLAESLNRTGSQLTPSQSERLDTAVSNNNWKRVKNLVDKYISNLE